MTDEETRASERAGHVDVAAVLRAAPDAERRVEILRATAALGHGEARRWVKDLGLSRLTRAPSQPWTLLGQSGVCLWLAACAREGLLALSAAGKEPDPDSIAALDALGAFFAGEIDRAALERAAVRADMAKDRLNAESADESEWLLLAARAAAYSVYRISWIPILDPSGPSHWQVEGVLRDVNTARTLLERHPSEELEDARQLVLLRDGYLWPEVTGP